MRMNNEQLDDKSRLLDQLGKELEGKNPLTNISAFSRAAKLQTEIVQELARREIESAQRHG